MKTRRLCFACDLKDDDLLIDQYKKYHSKDHIWPEIKQSIRDAGVEEMQIFLIKNRLFMIMEVNENYNPEKKKEMDLNNLRVQEWENLMMTFQQLLPWSNSGDKWMPMEQIFSLAD